MATASSVTQFGITWTFDTTYTVGTFANGDSWVLDPGSGVTINSTTPAHTDTSGWIQNGMMSNPSASSTAGNGFDSSAQSYSSPLNIADDLPTTFAGGTSLVKADSVGSAGQRPQLQVAAVLTIVATTPASGDFRPPYCGTDKTLNWNKTDLDYTKLHSLAQPNSGTNVPAISSNEGNFERPWIEIHTSVNGRDIHPNANQPDYGREMAREIGKGLLQLQLDYSDAAKETLLVRMVQYGIDIYGSAVSGGYWQDKGGHNHGRKAVLLMAAHVLGDANMLAYADKVQHNIFQEDRQTYLVAATDYDTETEAAHTADATYISKGYTLAWVEGEDHYTAVDSDGRRRTAHTAADIGLAEWGEQHSSQKVRDGKNWSATYRGIVGPSLIAGPLVAQMLGLTTQWNWSPLFDYMDRYWSIEEVNRANETNEIHLFEADMWDAYRYIGAPDPATKIDAATADLPGGTYDSTQGLTFTEAASTTTYYTTNGSEPSDGSTEYTGSISISSTTTVRWITYDDTVTLLPSELQSSTFTIACVTPVISPSGGSYESSQSVTITTATAAATLYYTTDGTTPTTGSTVYAGAFFVGADATVQTFALKAGLSDSAIQSATFSINTYSPLPDDWLNLTTPSESATFSYQFTAIPESLGVDCLMSFSETAIANPLLNTDFDELACTIRFFTNNQIEVRNGGSYTNDITITYEASTSYLFEVTINISAHTYTVTCTPEVSAPQIIATDYAFRTEQAAVATLANFSMWAKENGDLTPSDGFVVTKFFKVESVPVIKPQFASSALLI